MYLLAVIALACAAAQAQNVTSYGGLKASGTTAGTGGGYTNSYFGHQAGLSNTATNNSALGYQALLNNTTATRNVALGVSALYTQSYKNGGTSWTSDNVAVGFEALYTNNSTHYFNGIQNTAVGTQSLRSNSTGYYNTATGYQALYSNSTARYNTATGYQALFNNTTAGSNVAIGYYALYTQSFSNKGEIWDSENVAVGYKALYLNNPTHSLNGTQNTALGNMALRDNSTGSNNTATGFQALVSNTTGYNNTATGYEALFYNTTGGYNTAVGYLSLRYNTTGSCNTAIGYGADTYNNSGYFVYNFTNSTALGSTAVVNASNKIRLGNASVSVIEGQAAYSVASDGRFKTNIQEKDVQGLSFINRLRPVVYNFDTKKFTEFLTQRMPDSIRKHYLEDDFGPSTAIRQSGFIAQEVEQAAQAVGYDFNGLHKPDSEHDYYSLAYSQFVVPLVKAVQELSVQTEAQQQRIEKLQQEVVDLKKQLVQHPQNPRRQR